MALTFYLKRDKDTKQSQEIKKKLHEMETNPAIRLRLSIQPKNTQDELIQKQYAKLKEQLSGLSLGTVFLKVTTYAFLSVQEEAKAVCSVEGQEELQVVALQELIPASLVPEGATTSAEAPEKAGKGK